MSHPYIPISDEDLEQMLREIGVSSFEELLRDIPEEARFRGKLNLPEPLSELEVEELLEDIASTNSTDRIIFLGAGAYDHYIPRAIDHIISRPEFYTAYTPYQAEVSQGTLQGMYEYQSLICELTGMDVSNASMYDGASALAEALLMALRIKGKGRVLIAESINPRYRQVVETYLHGQSIEIRYVGYDKETGQVDLEELKREAEKGGVAFAFQHPNFFGVLEDPFEIKSIVKNAGLLLISVFDPISLGILAPPGEYDADIAVAEGQALGIPLSFGGPYLGIFTSKREYIRKLPGRISGMTVDVEGRRGFVMALQTREQHIRRERATSNICTNQNLCALMAAVYLSLMGKEGIKEVALQSLFKAHYLGEKLKELGLEIRYKAPYFKEFTLKLPIEAQLVADRMKEKGILAGVPLSQFGMEENLLLVAVTEKRKKKELDLYVESMKEVLES